MVVSALIAVLLVSSLVACSNPPPPTSTSGTTSANQAQGEKIQLSLVAHITSADAKPWYTLKTFADKVKERSGGRLEIVIKGGPEVFPPADLLTKCKDGLVDMAFCSVGSWTPIAPELGYDGLPYEVNWSGVTSIMDATRPIVDKVYDKYGVKLVGNIYPSGPFMLATKTPVRSAADLKGMVLRGHGMMPAVILESLGASAVVMPFGEVVPALERGVVNGVMIAIPSMQDFKFWDLKVNYVVDYELAFAMACSVIVNQRAYNRLSPELQKILIDVGTQEEKEMSAYWKQQEATIVADLKAHGIAFYTLPADEASRWRAASVAAAKPAFLGIKGIDPAIAQKFVDLMDKKW